MASVDSGRLEQAEARIAWVLAQPGTSEWLRTALKGALERDPIDVLNELEILSHALRLRCLALLARSNTGPARDHAM